MLVPEIGLTPAASAVQKPLACRWRCTPGLPTQSADEAAANGRAGDHRHPFGHFHPLANPGAIIVDEEHDGSYKQHDGLRYHAET